MSPADNCALRGALRDRLPGYYRALIDLAAKDQLRVNSCILAEYLGITPSQVRQDLHAIGAEGQKGYGYSVRMLHAAVSGILGLGDIYSAVIVADGPLAPLLSSIPLLTRRGLRLNGTFGVTPEELQKLDDLLAEKPADIVLMALAPETAPMAPEILERLKNRGVRGVWNCSEYLLQGTEDLPVENFCASESIMRLCCAVRQKDLPEDFSLR